MATCRFFLFSLFLKGFQLAVVGVFASLTATTSPLTSMKILINSPACIAHGHHQNHINKYFLHNPSLLTAVANSPLYTLHFPLQPCQSAQQQFIDNLKSPAALLDVLTYIIYIIKEVAEGVK